MGGPARLRRKLKRAEHFATLAAQRWRTRAHRRLRVPHGERGAQGGRRVGAPKAAVNAAGGAEHSPAERCAGAPQAAVNAAATEAVARDRLEGALIMVLVNGKESPAVFTRGVVYVVGPVASPAPEPPASRPQAAAGGAAESSRSRRGGSRSPRSTDTGRCGAMCATPSARRLD